MKKNNELKIIIITTVTFGVLGRLLVRVPYMACFGEVISTSSIYGIWRLFKWFFYIGNIMVGL